MNRYIFFCSYSYSYSILRPLQRAIRERGDEVAWFLENTCDDMLRDGEQRLYTISEVKDYRPLAIITAGNYIYPFMPGIKVCVFHGYPINKRAQKQDDHFRLRGWFDMYCTQSPLSTEPFQALAEKKRYFAVYETGWPKVDDFFRTDDNTAGERKEHKPTIVYACTFTKGVSSAAILAPVIEELIQQRPWRWILTLHPKIDDVDVINHYTTLAVRYPNVMFRKQLTTDDLRAADVMLCDTSSIILEFQILDKPVVTFRNTNPGPQLINVTQTDEVRAALEQALNRPPQLMEQIRSYTSQFEAHRDGNNSQRVLSAIDDFIQNRQQYMKPKPRNLLRKWKLWRASRAYRH